MSEPGVSAPLLNVVLVRPEIPQNTGSIARLTAAMRIRLHLIKPLGFSLEDRYLKRAGLDYWPLVDLRVHQDYRAFLSDQKFPSDQGRPQLKVFSARARRSYLTAHYQAGDYLVFGSETKGLGAAMIAEHAEQAYRIPIFEPGVRSLNLANAVSIVVFEGLRQLGALAEPAAD